MKYKPHKNEFWNEKEAKKLFQILPFYNVLIKKTKIKHLSNVELLHELPFYDQLSVVEISKAFKGYASSYKIEIIDSKDPCNGKGRVASCELRVTSCKVKSTS